MRKSVRSRLIDLHNRIYSQFEDYGISELYENSNKRFQTSVPNINPYSGETIRSIWLHYGKSKEQLNKFSEKESFTAHVRLQVIIQEENEPSTVPAHSRQEGSEPRVDFKHARWRQREY